jgi:hypothetical protein
MKMNQMNEGNMKGQDNVKDADERESETQY